jgi:hypothetical protein
VTAIRCRLRSALLRFRRLARGCLTRRCCCRTQEIAEAAGSLALARRDIC